MMRSKDTVSTQKGQHKRHVAPPPTSSASAWEVKLDDKALEESLSREGQMFLRAGCILYFPRRSHTRTLEVLL